MGTVDNMRRNMIVDITRNNADNQDSRKEEADKRICGSARRESSASQVCLRVRKHAVEGGVELVQSV